MVFINPWLDNNKTFLTTQEFRIYATLHYIDYAVFFGCLILVLINIWEIIIK